jgi:hypothetical protein
VFADNLCIRCFAETLGKSHRSSGATAATIGFGDETASRVRRSVGVARDTLNQQHFCSSAPLAAPDESSCGCASPRDAEAASTGTLNAY